MSKRVVVYMSPWCYTSKDTQSALNEWGVPATFINIKEDHAAAARVRGWVGFESVPTIVIAEGEGVEPFEAPAPLVGRQQPTRRGPRQHDDRGHAQPTPRLAGQARIPGRIARRYCGRKNRTTETARRSLWDGEHEVFLSFSVVSVSPWLS